MAILGKAIKLGYRWILFRLYIFILFLVSPGFINAQDSSPTTASDFEKPNIIIILSDDQGYGDFSCHGNPILKTPALDSLHDESIRFDDFHVAPLCTPSRGQLMTGMDALK